MSTSEYSKIMKSIFATVAGALLISLGSVFANYTISRYQVQENKKQIELKADKEFVLQKVSEAKEIATEKELRYKEAIDKLNKDVVDLKKSADKQMDLLWKINDKIK